MQAFAIGRRRSKGLWGLGLSLPLASASLAAEMPGQWIVVTPAAFRDALAPLIELRQRQGFRVLVLLTTEVLPQNRTDGVALQATLRDHTADAHHSIIQSKGKNYILLVGAFGAAGLPEATNTVPSVQGRVGRMKGELTDSGYGEPTQDGTPTAAVGRFPARDATEVSAMVQKTLKFECDSTPAPWRNRLLLLIGNPGGGPLAEMFVQQTLSHELASLHPSWEARTLFNAASSPYYLPRPRDREAALRYLGEGNLFSVFLGHSYAAGLGLDGKFLTRADWAALSIPKGAGPLFTCGCFALQSSSQGDGYGLTAMRNPAGPVAIVGATGETYSMAGLLAVKGLLACVREPPFPSRLGDYWLGVGAGLARGKLDEATFALLDLADGSGGKVPLAIQRREHLEMWMLLGDPALRMPVMPQDVSLRVTGPIGAGQQLAVSGLLPDRLKGAAVHLSLARPLDSVPTSLEALAPNSATNRDARERAFIARHQSANSFVLATAEAKASGNHFVASLAAPANLGWSNLVLRASAALSNEVGLAATSVPVQP